ncbi:hypothetical protein PAHAL_2G208300 [Panicum hallii]|uniref:Uncharacterized protein n=1 Tax=Panicum hallii TaxID=206008 RepID=A0A2T8KPT4_9POAL|nr:hypothetical protein PAHAL_2G208300 [Panicum hallii]PVH64175.1 hypothetical protein PAHAL_2G208300 [Panicum hallii]PVH64176.1 hypothetical protein PAHAL_2G208300 [Panicum hallii]PVH64177.1 hypothetical protein PAHAL_2G208300 [Panicum hallii]PVH64178.1 hypothetical protein PAHAL_2G208300 [Panicum hallii]
MADHAYAGALYPITVIVTGGTSLLQVGHHKFDNTNVLTPQRHTPARHFCINPSHSLELLPAAAPPPLRRRRRPLPRDSDPAWVRLGGRGATRASASSRRTASRAWARTPPCTSNTRAPRAATARRGARRPSPRASACLPCPGSRCPSSAAINHRLAALHLLEGDVHALAVARGVFFTASNSIRVRSWAAPGCFNCGYLDVGRGCVPALAACGGTLVTSHSRDHHVRVWTICAAAVCDHIRRSSRI